MTTVKIDFKKTLDGYRATRGNVRVLDVPEQRFLMIDGHGDPNTSPRFAEAVQSLYAVAYAIKFASKQEPGRDYVVPPLEGLWWSDDMSTFTTARDKARWNWTMMIMLPDWIDGELYSAVVDGVRANRRLPRLDDLRLETLHEGRCVQILHVGSFDDEAALLAELHDTFIPEHDLRMTGRHHEIYLSDPRRTAPDRQRTILRQPVG